MSTTAAHSSAQEASVSTDMQTLQKSVQQGDPQACWLWVQQLEQQGSAPHQLEAQNRIQLLNYAAQRGIGSAAILLGRWHLQGHYVSADVPRAILYFELAGQLGKEGLGYYHLAEMFQTGTGVPLDLDKGKQYLQKAVAMGQPDAIFTHACQLLEETASHHITQVWRLLTDNYLKRHHLPSIQTLVSDTRFDDQQVERWLLEHAEQDMTIASFLAVRYWERGPLDKALLWAERAAQARQPIGSYVRAMLEYQQPSPNSDLIQRLMLEAAQQGHIEAAYQVGMDLLAVQSPDAAQTQSALTWLAQAAHSQHAGAQFALSQCWLQGVGVEANRQEALAWLERAAIQGHIEAIFSLALQLPASHEQHLPMLQQAAEAGHTKAMLCVGLYLQQHATDDTQLKQAIEWFERAQAQGDSRAYYLLGLTYRDGVGVQADAKQAVALLNAAGERGDADGYFTLYESYRDGIGMRKNKKSKEKYFKLAQLAHHPKTLTTDQSSLEL